MTLRLLRQHSVQDGADELGPHQDGVRRELVVVAPQGHHVVHAVLRVEHVYPHAVLAVVGVHDAIVAQPCGGPLRERLLRRGARRETEELLLFRVWRDKGPLVGAVRGFDDAGLRRRGEPLGARVGGGRRGLAGGLRVAHGGRWGHVSR